MEPFAAPDITRDRETTVGLALPGSAGLSRTAVGTPRWSSSVAGAILQTVSKNNRYQVVKNQPGRCGPEGLAIMTTMTPSELSHRDRAVLRAVAAGRCVVSGDVGMSLLIDGRYCSDQFAGVRLSGAGLIAASVSRPGPAKITLSGRTLLGVS
jgi:hypothetical protein